MISDTVKKKPGFTAAAEKTALFLNGLTDRKKNLLLAATPFFISFLVKLFLLSSLYHEAINSDGIVYIAAAKQIFSGNIAGAIDIYPMPFYPILLALVNFCLNNWVLSGYMISIFSMSLAAVPLYFITKTMFGRGPGFFAALVFALLPKFNDWSLYISRDSLFLMIFAWCIYFALQSLKERGAFYFWGTFLLAWMGIFIRIEGVTFIIFFPCSLVVLNFTHGKDTWSWLKKALIWTGIPIFISLAIILITGANSICVNRFDQVFFEMTKLVNGTFLDPYFNMYHFFSEIENHPPFSGMHYNFAALARHYLFIIYMLGIVEVIIKIVSPLSFIPLYVAMKRSRPFFKKFIISLAIIFTAVTYYSLITRDFLATKFLMVPGFLLLPWVGAGIDMLWSKAAPFYKNKGRAILIGSIFLAPAVKTLFL